MVACSMFIDNWLNDRCMQRSQLGRLIPAHPIIQFLRLLCEYCVRCLFSKQLRLFCVYICITQHDSTGYMYIGMAVVVKHEDLAFM